MDQEGFQSRDFVLYYKQNSQPFCFIRLYPGWNSLIVRSTVTSGDHSHLGTVQPPRYVTVDDKMHVFHDINPIRNKSNLFRKQGLSPLLRAPGDGMVHSQSCQFLCHRLWLIVSTILFGKIDLLHSFLDEFRKVQFKEGELAHLSSSARGLYPESVSLNFYIRHLWHWSNLSSFKEVISNWICSSNKFFNQEWHAMTQQSIPSYVHFW